MFKADKNWLATFKNEPKQMNNAPHSTSSALLVPHP